MSRICGIVGTDWSQERVERSLASLIPPLCHSVHHHTEQMSEPQCALARVFFRSYNFSTHLYSTPDRVVTCVFTGYLFEPHSLAAQLNLDSYGASANSNPALLIAHLYPRFRSRMLRDLSGSFAFALWERESATLTLGIDRFGVTSLYYREIPAGFAFASEIKSLLRLSPVSGTNHLALSELLALGSPFADHTLFDSISRIAPATVMTVRDGRITHEKYWSFADHQSGPIPSVPEFVEESCRLLNRSVAKLAAQIDKPICLLSAGYDSRRLLFELAKHEKPVIAYTAPTVTQPDPPITVDVPVASALCQALGVSHVSSALPDPGRYGLFHRHAQTLLDYESDSHPWICPLLESIPVASGVNFDGLGGDVLFEFNWTYPHLVDIIDNPAALASAVEDRYPDFWRSFLRTPPPARTLQDRYREMFAALPDFADRITAFFFSNWARRKTALFSQGLLSLKIDSVYPFLDYDLVEFVLKLPPLVRRESRVSYLMLEHVHPDIMTRIPTSHDSELLSAAVNRWRSFQTPLPSDYWHRMQASIHRAAAEDICRSPQVFGQLTTAARASTLANLLPIPSRMTPAKITASSWRLPLLGLYARQHRSARDPRVAEDKLASARRFLFSD